MPSPKRHTKKTFRIFSNEKRIATAVSLSDEALLLQVYPTKQIFDDGVAWKRHWHDKMALTVEEEESKAKKEQKKAWNFVETNFMCFPAGEYYIGDPCYALPIDIYDNVFGGKGFGMGYYSHRQDSDKCFLVGQTYAGDGCYRGTDKNKYIVDSGTIAIMPYSLAKDNLSVKIGTKHTFKEPVHAKMDDGMFTFTSGTKRIKVDTTW